MAWVNEPTSSKVGKFVASFAGHVGGVRKWPENEATASKMGELVASFPGHVGGARKWPENEATAMNCQ